MAVESTETTRKIMTAIGLMSGTSMDGIDIAILRTDGAHVEFGAFSTIPTTTTCAKACAVFWERTTTGTVA